MKKRFIDELNEGELVQDVFLVKQSLLKTTKSGNFYLDLTLADRTGTVGAVLWDANRQLHESFAPDDFIMVRATAAEYKGRPQLVVSHLKKVEEDKIDLADFLPASERDPKEMLKELHELIAGVQDPPLKALLKAFFEDKEFEQAFARCPAATKLHHAFLGGLLEHTLGVTRMALEVAGHYPHVDRDMLLAGALLHDIGKIDELEYTRAFNYSDRGMLLGHLTIGASQVEQRAAELKDFPPEKLLQLRHLILSHHGKHEYGSPKQPMTVEAVALHYLDNLDAKMQGFKEAEPVDGNWTDWLTMFDGRVYIPRDREDAT